MSKRIKVGEIREIDKANEKVEVLEFEELEIEVKQYIPMAEKRLIAETVVRAAFIVDEEAGLNRFDRALADVAWGVLLVQNYTNINSIQDTFQMYDVIKANGILEAVEEAIPEEEVNTLVTIIRTRVNETFRLEEAQLSIGHQVEGLMNMLVDKIDSSLDAIKNFDMEELQTLTEIVKIEEDDNTQ